MNNHEKSSKIIKKSLKIKKNHEKSWKMTRHMPFLPEEPPFRQIQEPPIETAPKPGQLTDVAHARDPGDSKLFWSESFTLLINSVKMC